MATTAEVIEGLNAAWTLAHSKERKEVPPYLLTDAVHEIERLVREIERLRKVRDAAIAVSCLIDDKARQDGGAYIAFHELDAALAASQPQP